jgi:hypothetical protein
LCRPSKHEQIGPVLVRADVLQKCKGTVVTGGRSGGCEHDPRNTSRQRHDERAALGAWIEMMCLVDNQQIERNGVDCAAHVAAFDQIDRRDRNLGRFPRIHADRKRGQHRRQRGMVEHLRIEREAVAQFRRPLLT